MNLFEVNEVSFHHTAIIQICQHSQHVLHVSIPTDMQKLLALGLPPPPPPGPFQGCFLPPVLHGSFRNLNLEYMEQACKFMLLRR